MTALFPKWTNYLTAVVTALVVLGAPTLVFLVWYYISPWYLEVGYAWGRDIPVVLVVPDTADLKFDVRGQRCLVYKNIRGLEQSLEVELSKLAEQGAV